MVGGGGIILVSIKLSFDVACIQKVLKRYYH